MLHAELVDEMTDAAPPKSDCAGAMTTGGVTSEVNAVNYNAVNPLRDAIEPTIALLFAYIC